MSRPLHHRAARAAKAHPVVRGSVRVAKTRPAFLLAVGVVGVLLAGALLLVGVLSQLWWLVALVGWALASAVLLLQLDTWRRAVRAGRPGVRGTAPVDSPATTLTATDDAVGAVRLMQAQYVGRLDRMQSALDAALQELTDRDSSVPPRG